MRDVTCRYLQAVGSAEDTSAATKSLADFVREIPSLLSFRLIPPLAVLNGVFRTGEHDAGMSDGYVWDPFDIDADEYEELAGELQACGMRRVGPPEWVQNRVDWQLWTFAFEVSIPADEHYRLWREDERWTQLKTMAHEEGNEERVLAYHLKAVDAGQRLRT